MKKLLIIMSFGALLTGCNQAENTKLKSQVDSLQVELQTSQEMAKTLQEVGTMMDSIDQSRQLLRMNMVEGTTFTDYNARMKDLNNYVKDTQSKISDLEKSLKKSKANANAFSATVKKLKADLEQKNGQIALLQQKVDELGNQNENMKITIDMQEAELNDKQTQIETKTQELALIEAKIQELMIQSKMTEADSYYARAQAVEEAANRTKLAPRKKKDTLKEALELYKKSLSLGKTEAQAKIDELEKRVK